MQAGNAKAQFRLGKLLLKRNVSEQAVGWEWMKKSADQNHAPAMFFLGLWEFIKGGAMHGQSLKAAADQGYFAALGALDILECIRRSQSRFQVAFHPGRIEKNLSELVAYPRRSRFNRKHWSWTRCPVSIAWCGS